jgi:hypothetical protein
VYDATVWGTAAQWVSGLGGTAAFLATSYVIWRDARLRRTAQLRKITFYERPVDEGIVATLVNRSDEAIYRVCLRNRDLAEWKSALLPGEPLEIRMDTDGASAIFTDASGTIWSFTSPDKGPRELGRLAQRKPRADYRREWQAVRGLGVGSLSLPGSPTADAGHREPAQSLGSSHPRERASNVTPDRAGDAAE